MTTSHLSSPVAWNAVAAGYDRDVRPWFATYVDFALLAAPLQSEHRVLDLCCGPGTLTLRAARLAREVVGVDFSTAMLERLRAGLAAEQLSNVVVHEADACQWQPEAAGFNRIYSIFGLIFFPDPESVLRRARSWLVPGGLLCFTAWVPAREVAAYGILGAAIGDVLGPQEPSPPSPLTDSETLAELGRAAGFQSVHVQRVQASVTYASGEQMWQTIKDSNAMLVPLAERLGPRGYESLGAAVARHADAHFQRHGSTLCFPAQVVTLGG